MFLRIVLYFMATEIIKVSKKKKGRDTQAQAGPECPQKPLFGGKWGKIKQKEAERGGTERNRDGDQGGRRDTWGGREGSGASGRVGVPSRSRGLARSVPGTTGGGDGRALGPSGRPAAPHADHAPHSGHALLLLPPAGRSPRAPARGVAEGGAACGGGHLLVPPVLSVLAGGRSQAGVPGPGLRPRGRAGGDPALPGAGSRGAVSARPR